MPTHELAPGSRVPARSARARSRRRWLLLDRAVSALVGAVVLTLSLLVGLGAPEVSPVDDPRAVPVGSGG